MRTRERLGRVLPLLACLVACNASGADPETTTAATTDGDSGTSAGESSGSTGAGGSTSSNPGSTSGTSSETTTSLDDTSDGSETSVDGSESTTAAEPFTLTSTAFAEGEVVPTIYECGPITNPDGVGEDLSPPLEWTPGPAETLSYALVLQDIDSSVIHWVVYDIPADASALPEGIAPGYMVADPAGTRQAELQGSGYFGYFGPCSPVAVNTYRWTLYAMPTATLPGASMDSTEAELAQDIPAMALASAALSGES